MTNPQITLEEALKLVDFQQEPDGTWCVKDVKGNVKGYVDGDVEGDVWGKINNRKWVFEETRKERFLRLLKKTSDAHLIKAFNQLNEDS